MIRGLFNTTQKKLYKINEASNYLDTQSKVKQFKNLLHKSKYAT